MKQLVQVTDAVGHPAVAWLQNSNLYLYNYYLQQSGGDAELINSDVTNIVKTVPQNDVIGLEYQKDGKLITWLP